MNPKVVGEAPSMPMGVLFLTWRDYLKEVSIQEREKDLFHDLLDPDERGSAGSRGDSAMFASAAPADFDWGDEGGKDAGGDRGGGKDGGHRGAAHEAHGGDDVTMALSLFKAFGHGDFDL